MTVQEIVDEMSVQDNRASQYPLFCVYEIVERSVGDGQGESKRKDPDYYNGEGLCEDCKKLLDKDKDLPDYCYNCDEDCFWNCEESLEPNLRAGVFFTAKACQEHIDENGYHYNKPVVYGIDAWRNPEMVAVMQHLFTIGAKALPNHYK